MTGKTALLRLRLPFFCWLAASLLSALCTGLTASAATLYVWQDSPSPGPPYDTWLNAATNIQDAVDAADPGDTVLVTNGVYATGGRAVVGLMTNRVAIDKAIRVESLTGPDMTLIVGAPSPGGTNGDGAVRCAYVGTNAVLSGFTLTNGHTLFGSRGYELVRGGGAWSEASGVLTNCLLTGNSAHDDGAGVHGGTLYYCTLVNNHGSDEDADGGGADHSTLFYSTLYGNSARKGGGADNCELYCCLLLDNSARVRGGGATRSELYNCTVLDNSSRQGGGLSECSVYNSIVYHNQAPFGPNYDVDAFYQSFFNYSCTTPLPQAGAANIALAPQMASWTHLSTASPCVGSGSALYTSGLDIDGQPWGNPPCMGADQLTPGMATGPLSVELEADFTKVAVGFAASFKIRVEGQTTGNRWEFGDGTLLTNRLEAVHTWSNGGNYPVRLTVFNDSHPDGVTATVTMEVVQPPCSYVNPANPGPAFPFASWETAATNIQDAIAAGAVAGRVVLVTNGVYDTGGVAVYGQMTNRIALTNGVILRSLNGPEVTLIQGAPDPSGTNGDGAIRCAYVGDGSVLDGFTLTNGHTRTEGHTSREQGGGGAWCERTGVVTNCVFVGNQAFRDGGGANGGIFYACTFRDNRAWDDSGGVDDAVLYDCILRDNLAGGRGGGASESVLHRCLLTGNSTSGYSGGGAWASTLNHCVLTGNVSPYIGGGTLESMLNNCTLTGNSAHFGGGIYHSIPNNCILYYNTAAIGANYSDSDFAPNDLLSYCCTTPMPPNGVGNITNAPLFVDYAAGNLRLQSNSPCINSGNNAYVPGNTDLDGRSRIVGGTVDMGAYESQGLGMSEFIAWLAEFGLPTDGSVDFVDSDNDRLNNWQEWHCQTDPTNALSVLRLLSVSPQGTNLLLTWQSVAGVDYFLERSTNLATFPPFFPLATNLVGQAGMTTFTDTNAANWRQSVYRVGVAAP